MLKVSTPLDSKVCQAGSYAFPVLPTGKVTKKAYLYMAMLDILTMICDHRKAGVALIKQCQCRCENQMDFLMAED